MQRRGFRFSYVLIIAVLLAIGVFALRSSYSISIAPQNTLSFFRDLKDANNSNATTTPSVKIGKTAIQVEIVKDAKAVQKGLSGRASLDPKGGMLFVFQESAIYRFWMPNMHFPIDIIWIDAEKKIIGISADVSNEFDPSNPRFYSSPLPARYVLEVNAGFAEKNGISVGDEVRFNNIE